MTYLRASLAIFLLSWLGAGVPRALASDCLPGAEAARKDPFSNWFTDVKRVSDEVLKPSQGDVPRPPSVLVKTLSPAQARALFGELASAPGIPFDFPQDGCAARAHEMARILEEKGILSRKLFVQGDSMGDLMARTEKSAKGYVRWKYHVAPSIQVRQGDGRVVTWVLDPSLFDGPVTVDELVSRITGHQPNRKVRVFSRPRFTYKPDDEPRDSWDPDELKDASSKMPHYRLMRAEMDARDEALLRKAERIRQRMRERERARGSSR